MGVPALRKHARDFAVSHFGNTNGSADISSSCVNFPFTERNLFYAPIRHSLLFADTLGLAAMPVEQPIIQRTDPQLSVRSSKRRHINVIRCGVEPLEHRAVKDQQT
jgi:hypothetical protein